MTGARNSINPLFVNHDLPYYVLVGIVQDDGIDTGWNGTQVNRSKRSTLYSECMISVNLSSQVIIDIEDERQFCPTSESDHKLPVVGNRADIHFQGIFIADADISSREG